MDNSTLADRELNGGVFRLPESRWIFDMSWMDSLLLNEPIPPAWLSNGHLQTIYAKSLQRKTPDYRRELIVDSYGEDLVAYDFVDADDKLAPCVVLFHGLEGSSQSHYAVELMHAVKAKGWHGVVAHFRSCGGVYSRRMYHSGDTHELAYMLSVLAKRYQYIYAVGVSLGGNVLAKYLGEKGVDVPIQAAAVVSSPVDLSVAGVALDTGVAKWIYTPYFLRTLLHKVPPAKEKITSLGTFDNLYTAPINGFLDKEDYYRQSSALPYLSSIKIPTLLLNAKNDPFFPAQYLPTEQDVSESVCLYQPEHGGHVGFVCGSGRGHLRWLPETLLRFFDGYICSTLK